MEKGIPHKWKSEESWSSNTSDKIKFKIKIVNKKQRRALHNDQKINPRKSYNNCKYICTEHRNTSICKANVNRQKQKN